jgi:hypothetical protein
VIILIPIEHSHTRMRGAMSNKLGRVHHSGPRRDACRPGPPSTRPP